MSFDNQAALPDDGMPLIAHRPQIARILGEEMACTGATIKQAHGMPWGPIISKGRVPGTPCCAGYIEDRETRRGFVAPSYCSYIITFEPVSQRFMEEVPKHGGREFELVNAEVSCPHG